MWYSHSFSLSWWSTHKLEDLLTLFAALFILGSLRVKLQDWLSGCGRKHCSANCCHGKVKLLKSLHDFPERFASCHILGETSVTYNDEDFDAWEFEAKRWARVLFLAIKEEQHLEPIRTVCLSFLCSTVVWSSLFLSSLCSYIITRSISCIAVFLVVFFSSVIVFVSVFFVLVCVAVEGNN